MDRPQETELFFLILVGTSVTFGLALAVVFFFIIYQRRIIKQQIQLQQAKTVYQQKLLQATIALQEGERARIAKDLHDDVGSALAAASLFVHQLLMHDQAPKIEEIGQELKEILQSTIENVRGISHELLPVALESFGLQEAVGAMADRLQRASGAHMEVRYEAEDIPRLSTDQEVALYRISNELINNVLKHAGAKKLRIQLKNKKRNISLIIADDGKGFIIPSGGLMRESAGLGLNNIAARAEYIGASVDFHSEAGQGTTVTVNLPLS